MVADEIAPEPGDDTGVTVADDHRAEVADRGVSGHRCPLYRTRLVPTPDLGAVNFMSAARVFAGGRVDVG